jgi:hypothetical protein
VFIVYPNNGNKKREGQKKMDTRNGKDKQTNNGHKKGEGQTDKQ